VTQSRLSDVSAKSDVQELIQNIPRRPLVVDYIVVQKSFCGVLMPLERLVLSIGESGALAQKTQVRS